MSTPRTPTRTVRHRVLVGAAAASALGLSLAACGGSSSSHSSPSPSPSSGATSAPMTPAPATGSGAVLSVRHDPALGDVVVDSRGFTLYRFDHDTSSPPKSNCAGACATTWPPETTSGAPQATGVAAGEVGTVTRADGTAQVTVGGHPVYLYSGDSAAGQDNGQGVMGIWFAVTPTGGKATAQTSSSGGSSGGYGY